MELQISPSENLARYILEKNKFNKVQMRPKYNAFLPSSSRKTSVFRITELSETEVWEIGRINVAEIIDKTLYARADIIVLNVLNQKLDVEASQKSHPRHANIVGWPQDKAEQIIIATELAEAAQLHLYEPSDVST